MRSLTPPPQHGSAINVSMWSGIDFIDNGSIQSLSNCSFEIPAMRTTDSDSQYRLDSTIILFTTSYFAALASELGICATKVVRRCPGINNCW
mmetsp:Transcript_14486/g.26264  ORF Transcript_14486/g.26264 Transcript_14486/m.26264 type:complete len:92 (+) Transcript_14486:343-618(+)